MNASLDEQPMENGDAGKHLLGNPQRLPAMQLFIDASCRHIAPELRPFYAHYIAALLAPDVRAAMQVTGAYVRSPEHIASWWEQVIQPAMYMIGDLWAQGWISVGQEHLATAITQRVMAAYYPLILELPRHKGPIVFTASAGEHHEIGLRIAADLFEIHGWDVVFIGANTPEEGTIQVLEQTGSPFLCISTTLVESAPAVRELIAQVRAACIRPEPKILVGGQAYRAEPDLWRSVGADWFAATPQDGIDYLERAVISGGSRP